jgi:hypothetical protein
LQPVPILETRVSLWDVKGRWVLREARATDESLGVTNGFFDGDYVVYQVVIQSDGGSGLLREYRIAYRGAPGGTLRQTRTWKEQTVGYGFRAQLGPALMTCELRPVGLRVISPGHDNPG